MAGISRTFFKVEPGHQVKFEERVYRITHLLSVDSLLAVDIVSGESTRLRIESVKPHTEGDAEESKPSAKDLLQYSDTQWNEAQRRLSLIKPLLDDPLRNRAAVEKVAAQEGVHAATLYKWLKAYQRAGHVSSLVLGTRGRKQGSRFLDKDLETIIQAAIEDKYLSKDRGTAQDVVDEVKRLCRVSKLKPPNHNSIRLRIRRLPPAPTLRRRGRADAARDKYDPIRGAFPGADHAYDLVQIDHTPANVIVVDATSRQPLARPWLTLAIDVHTRMVVGLHLSLDAPSAVSVGLTLSQAICPKREYLAKLGVPGQWPVWGTMGKVHCDNAKEFWSNALGRACDEYDIDLQYRLKEQPHYGGHIERLMGTAAGIFRQVPGRTFSNPQQRKGYDSEKESAFTLKELEAYFVDHIINRYHTRPHSVTKIAPQVAWEKSILGGDDKPGIGAIPQPADPFRVQLDFMPFVTRTCQRYGFRLDKIEYYDPVIDPFINEVDETTTRKRSFVLRRDPRDVSVVYFLDPTDDRYVPVPYRNMGRPAVSLWELRAAQKALEEEGLKDVDEDKLFETIERQRRRIDEAVSATKAARRKAARRPPGTRPVPQLDSKRSVPVPAEHISESVHPTATKPVDYVEDDPFAEPVTAFEVSLAR